LLQLRSATGITFNLPTKEEWQFVAKGGRKSKSFTYSGSNNLDDVGWYSKNSRSAQKIAQKAPNELGLYDMSGNYGEVCHNENDKEPSGLGFYFDIDGPICGGCWNTSASDCKVTSWIEGKVKGKIGVSGISEKNAFDGATYTVRLLYSRQKE